MTSEAEKFLRDLVKKDPGCCYEWVQEGDRIVSVKLRQSSLTEEQIKQAIYYAENHSPEISVEWRAEDDGLRGLSFNHLFIDDPIMDHSNDALPYITGKSYCSGFHISKSKKNTSISVTSYRPWRITKDHLLKDLKKAEEEEDYLLCSAIMKCAEENGIELKKE